MIEALNLKKIYGKKTVVKDFSATIKQGEIVGILGPNGCGKTTSFYMIAGVVKKNGGQIKLDGHDISGLPIHLRSRCGIGYLPQEESIFKDMTVEENIICALESKYKSPDKIKKELDKTLEKLSLHRVAKSKGFMLSGGERRRCEIARIISLKPRFVLLDEPFAGVDPVAVKEINDTILNLSQNNVGVLITDHNASAMLKICQRSYIMSEGKTIFSGTSQEIVQNEHIQEIYLGKNFNI